MSSCLSGSGRTCGFDLDIVKPLSSSSASARSFHSSSPSSTVSETSNSHRTISIKKARTPRKRPNQTYNEAAALLSTIYPNVFSANTTLKRLPRSTALSVDSFQDEVPELLPPFPVLGDDEFFIQGPPPPEVQRRLKQPLVFRLDLKPVSPSERSCTSSSSSLESPSYNSSPVLLEDDFDTESILDEEVDESIDSIMGSLTMNAGGGDNDEESDGYQTQLNPYLRNLIDLRTGGKYDFGLRLRYNKNMQQALRRRDEGEWWRTPAVPVGDIAPQLKSSAPPIEKKKKKKVEKNGKPQDVQPKAATIKCCTTIGAATTTTTTDSNKSKATALGLKLNHEEVLNAWSGVSMFTDGPDSPGSSADALAKLSDIDLFGDGSAAGGVREASVQRYKEKRRSRLFSKKIRYQVRKVNADSRPRMQGRFVRRPSLLQQAIEHEISQ